MHWQLQSIDMRFPRRGSQSRTIAGMWRCNRQATPQKRCSQISIERRSPDSQQCSQLKAATFIRLPHFDLLFKTTHRMVIMNIIQSCSVAGLYPFQPYFVFFTQMATIDISHHHLYSGLLLNVVTSVRNVSGACVYTDAAELVKQVEIIVVLLAGKVTTAMLGSETVKISAEASRMMHKTARTLRSIVFLNI